MSIFSIRQGRAMAWLMFVQVVLTTILLGYALVQSARESKRAKEQSLVNRQVIGFLCAELEEHRAKTEPAAPGVEVCETLPIEPEEEP